MGDSRQFVTSGVTLAVCGDFPIKIGTKLPYIEKNRTATKHALAGLKFIGGF